MQLAKYKWIILTSIICLLIMVIIGLNAIFSPPVVYKKIEIKIKSNYEHKFTTENEFTKILNKYNIKIGEPIHEDVLYKVEHEILQNKYVQKAKAYISYKNGFSLKIYEINPVARLFLKNGSSYYLNENYKLTPIKNSISIRLPIYTNIPIYKSNKTIDSNLIKKIFQLNRILAASPFWNPLVSDIEFYNDSILLIYLNLGHQILNFGNINNAFNKFFIAENFLRKIWNERGLNYYKYVNFTFDNEVIASKIAQYTDNNNPNLTKQTLTSIDSINNFINSNANTNPLTNSKSIPAFNLNNKNFVKKNTKLYTNIKNRTLDYQVADSKINLKPVLQPKALFKKLPQKNIKL
ncbi:MAG: hypothetical protein QM539_01570 [Alphaproteobacteria bacterium]|nr:hypothetical protein [Alphaproteobacteria bacterium]